MKKNVIVSLNGLHNIEGEEDTIELIAPGEYYYRNGKHYILYDDIDEETNEVTKNTVKISENSVEIKKSGKVNTSMLFEREKTNMSYYSTPFGDLAIESHTGAIELQAEENWMQITIYYSLILNKQHMSDCKVVLSVKEREE